ncbi:hypothetical protein EBU95_08530 [bacterium]|nr:hypothetical protein [bacterium]
MTKTTYVSDLPNSEDIYNTRVLCYDNYYINVRDFMTYPIDITETVDNLVFDFYKTDTGVLLVGIELTSPDEVLTCDARISCVITREYTIVRFVDMTPDTLFDEVLHTCTVEQVSNLPVQIYRDTNDKLVQIVVYENDMTYLMERITEMCVTHSGSVTH